jgi:hypothetical protein
VLPFSLYTGNVHRPILPGPGSQIIDELDVALVTSNYDTLKDDPYTDGDANGDRRVDETDLALVGSNYTRDAMTLKGHIIYSLPTDYQQFQNNHLWVGEDRDSKITLLGSDRHQDFWSAISPDGATLAFTRAQGEEQYIIYTAEMNGGKLRRERRLTPPEYKAFAASWAPDGKKSAFMCTQDDRWQYNETSLCVIEANGENFRVFASGPPYSLYPPAWWTNQDVYLDRYNSPELYSVNIASGAVVKSVYEGDKPVVRYVSESRFYFFRQTTDINLMLEIYDYSVPTETWERIGHSVIETPSMRWRDYYTVSEVGLNIILIRYQGSQFHIIEYTGTNTWADAGTYSVDSQVGDIHFGVPSTFWGMRNTVIWVP